MNVNKKNTNKGLKIAGNIVFVVLLVFILILLITIVIGNINGVSPSIFGCRILYVASGSMTPTVPIGSMVVIQAVKPDDIIQGDIVTYKGVGSILVTHRVVSVSYDKKSIITRGDANKSNDPLQVDMDNVVGKMVFQLPFMGALLMFFKYGPGLYILIACVVVIILLSIIFKKKRRV